MNAQPVENTTALQQKSGELVVKVLEFRVTDQASLEEAGRFAKALAELQSQINSSFDPIIEAAHKAHKAALVARHSHLEPLARAEGHLKSQSRAYLLAEQEKARLAALERQRDEEARQKQLREAEEKAQQEEFRLKAEADRKQRESEELLRQAEEAERQGKADEAAKLLEQAVRAVPEPVAPIRVVTPPAFTPPPAPPLPPPVTKVAGLGSRKVWRWRITNKLLVPREYLAINETLLNALSKSLKQPDAIPGIEFYPDIEMRRSS